METIVVTKRLCKFIATLKDQPATTASGDTLQNAIGRLIEQNSELFTFEVYVTEEQGSVLVRHPRNTRAKAHGKTFADALGDLVYFHSGDFGLEVEWDLEDEHTRDYLGAIDETREGARLQQLGFEEPYPGP